MHRLHTVLTGIWQSGTIPTDLEEDIVVPLGQHFPERQGKTAAEWNFFMVH